GKNRIPAESLKVVEISGHFPHGTQGLRSSAKTLGISAGFSNLAHVLRKSSALFSARTLPTTTLGPHWALSIRAGANPPLGTRVLRRAGDRWHGRPDSKIVGVIHSQALKVDDDRVGC